MSEEHHRIIPIYSSRGEVEAFLVFPYLFNRSGEWIGWVTPQREVYSVHRKLCRITDERPAHRPPAFGQCDPDHA